MCVLGIEPRALYTPQHVDDHRLGPYAKAHTCDLNPRGWCEASLAYLPGEIFSSKQNNTQRMEDV